MRKNYFGKGMVLGIVILFIGASILPSISGNENGFEQRNESYGINSVYSGVFDGAPGEDWNHTYGDSRPQYAWNVEQTDDEAPVLLLKTDSEGNQIWDKQYSDGYGNCSRLDTTDLSHFLSFDDELDQFQNQTEDCGWGVLEGNKLAQCFIPELNVITRVKLLIKQNEYFEDGKLTVSIRDSLTGDDLTNITINSSDFSSGTSTFVEFDFPDIAIVPGNNCYIIWYPYVSYLDWLISWRSSDNNPYPKGETYYFDLRIPDWVSFKFLDINHPDPDFVFLTYGFNNHAPNGPLITGVTNGKVQTEYEYSIVSTDPDNDEISYFIDWGDGNSSGWTRFRTSGDCLYTSYTWHQEGSYIIKVKTKDIHGLESDWSTLEITMPKNRVVNRSFLDSLENHPHLFPRLRQLLRL